MWLSGDGSTEVNFQGENVIRTLDYIELPSDNNKDGRTDSYYRILSKYAVETNRYIFVPLDVVRTTFSAGPLPIKKR